MNARDAFVAMFYRQVKRFWRAKARIIIMFIMPIVWLVFFGEGWASSMNFPGIELILGTDYLTFLVPGVVAMTIFMTSFMAGASVIWDKQFGFLKEVLVAPVPRWAAILGRALGDSVSATLQATMLLLLSFLLAPHLLLSGVVPAIGVELLSSLGFCAMGIAMASARSIKSFEAFQALVNIIMMPMLFASGAFFPLVNLPTWLDVLAKINPLTYTVDALRHVLANVGYFDIRVDIIAMLIFDVLMVLIAARSFERSTLD